jgi:hypothetical protein
VECEPIPRLFIYRYCTHLLNNIQFEVMYGRKAELPRLLHSNDSNTDVLVKSTIIHDKLRSTVGNNINSAQERQKRAFELQFVSASQHIVAV